MRRNLSQCTGPLHATATAPHPSICSAEAAEESCSAVWLVRVTPSRDITGEQQFCSAEPESPPYSCPIRIYIFTQVPGS